MLEQEADKDWIVSRWLDDVGMKTRQISPELNTNTSNAYRLGYLAAIDDFRAFLNQVGVYRK